MKQKHIIMILILVIIILALVLGMLILKQGSDDKTDTETNRTESASVDETPDTISMELTEFDREVTKTVGDYTLKAEKWRGTSVGGFEVSLYKNGQLMDRSSYQSRAYFDDGTGWKRSDWDDGEEDSTLHKYPVANDVDISKVEVRLL